MKSKEFVKNDICWYVVKADVEQQEIKNFYNFLQEVPPELKKPNKYEFFI